MKTKIHIFKDILKNLVELGAGYRGGSIRYYVTAAFLGLEVVGQLCISSEAPSVLPIGRHRAL